MLKILIPVPVLLVDGHTIKLQEPVVQAIAGVIKVLHAEQQVLAQHFALQLAAALLIVQEKHAEIMDVGELVAPALRLLFVLIIIAARQIAPEKHAEIMDAEELVLQGALRLQLASIINVHVFHHA
jgi:hypothetical protein